MALKTEQNHKEKQGLLALSYEVGQSLPFLDALRIPSRVDKEGGVEWVIRDPLDVWLDATYDLRDYLQQKEDRIYHSIFRGLSLFSRALMGFPVPLDYSGWPVQTLPVPDRAGQIPTLWEKGPWQVDRMAILSALQYLKPQT